MKLKIDLILGITAAVASTMDVLFLIFDEPAWAAAMYSAATTVLLAGAT